MRIIEQPRPVNRDGAIVQSAHQMLVTLAQGERVRTGTPIKPGPGGWVVDPTGESCWAFASTSAFGGETVGAWRSATVEYAQANPAWKNCPRLALQDVDDEGHMVFVPDETGRFVALNQNRVLLVPAHGG